MPPRVAVSVIVPTYNRAATLAESLESILGQTCSDFELIVADDGSTDDTEAVLARYGGTVRVLRVEHAGVAAARNAALAAAVGEFVAFHDSDDVALPDRLAVQCRELRGRPELGALMCDGWFDPAGTRPRLRRRPAPARPGARGG